MRGRNVINYHCCEFSPITMSIFVVVRGKFIKLEIQSRTSYVEWKLSEIIQSLNATPFQNNSTQFARRTQRSHILEQLWQCAHTKTEDTVRYIRYFHIKQINNAHLFRYRWTTLRVIVPLNKIVVDLWKSDLWKSDNEYIRPST